MMKDLLLLMTSTTANLRNSLTAAVLSTNATVAKSLSLVASLTVNRRMLSSLTPRRKIFFAKPVSSKKWEPVKLLVKSMVGLRSIGNACSAAQLLSSAALALTISASLAITNGAEGVALS